MAASESARNRFRQQVEAQGGRVVEPEWLGTAKRHRVICGAGHETSARPSDVNRGVGICRPCSGTDPATAWRAFQAVMAARGWTVTEPVYLGARKPHRITCAIGHDITLKPGEVINRDAGCRICKGKDQVTAWAAFCRIVSERGGRVLESGPLGVSVPHRVRCPEGHETLATPSYVRVGGGMCKVCGPTSKIRAEQEFRELVAALGGKFLESSWRGAASPHLVRCAEGHETAPRPSDARLSGSICRVCAGHCSETSWREFRERVAEMGGTVIEPEWLGNKKYHRIICRLGHETAVRPNNVDQGSGICRFCKCKVWDIFYVVTNDTAQTVKFGVTSHDPRSRLRFHQASGFNAVIKTITDLPDALDLERATKAALRLAGIRPVRGHEYFDLGALAVILDIADNWPREAITA